MAERTIAARIEANDAQIESMIAVDNSHG